MPTVILLTGGATFVARKLAAIVMAWLALVEGRNIKRGNVESEAYNQSLIKKLK